MIHIILKLRFQIVDIAYTCTRGIPQADKTPGKLPLLQHSNQNFLIHNYLNRCYIVVDDFFEMLNL